MTVGPIAPGKVLTAECGNSECWRPSHRRQEFPWAAEARRRTARREREAGGEYPLCRAGLHEMSPENSHKAGRYRTCKACRRAKRARVNKLVGGV